MANTARAGFEPIGDLTGAPYTGKVLLKEVDSSNSTAIFPGDPVTMEADGRCIPSAGGAIIYGVCVGIQHVKGFGSGTSGTLAGGGSNDLNLSLKYLPASTAGWILVVPAMGDTLFRVQEDGDTSDLALTDIGSNVDHILGTGSTTTGRSAALLDSNTATAAGSAGWRVVAFDDRVGNAIGDNCSWIVAAHERHWDQTNGI